MPELLADGRPRTLAEIDALYDVDGHAATRVEILRAGGYLTAEGRITDTPRSRAVLAMVRVLCGDEGPRAVAAFLRNRDKAQPNS